MLFRSCHLTESLPSCHSVQIYIERHFDADFALLKRSLTVLFSPGQHLPGSYERIYSACRVCVVHRGEGLFDALKIEVEKCVVDVAKRLQSDPKQGVQWLNTFVEACEWFEGQVVSF